jgi:hypothetical protein
MIILLISSLGCNKDTKDKLDIKVTEVKHFILS